MHFILLFSIALRGDSLYMYTYYIAIRQNVNPTLNRPEHDMQYNTYHVKNKTEIFRMLDT